MADVETLDELNSDHNPVLLKVDSSVTSQVLRGSGHYVRWDEFRRYLSPIELPSGIEAFTNSLRSAKIGGTVRRPHEAIQHFPGLSEIVAEKRSIWRRWQRYKQFGDKVELNRLTNLIQEKIRDFRIEKFEVDVQEASDIWISGSWPIGSKVLVDMLTRLSMEEAVLSMMQ